MGFSRQENWNGLPFPSPGDIPYPGIEPTSPALQADSLPLSHKEPVTVESTRGQLVSLHSERKEMENQNNIINNNTGTWKLDFANNKGVGLDWSSAHFNKGLGFFLKETGVCGPFGMS